MGVEVSGLTAFNVVQANTPSLSTKGDSGGEDIAQSLKVGQLTASGQPVASKAALNKAVRGHQTAANTAGDLKPQPPSLGRIARFPWEAKPVDRAPSKETVEQQRARFFQDIKLQDIKGSVAAEQNSKPLRVFSFKDSHGNLKLPNINDSSKNSAVIRDPNNAEGYVLKTYAVLQKNKDDIWKTTYVYSNLGAPLASDLMRHYLGASGETYEMIYDMRKLTTKSRLDNYRSELEKSAIKYAQDNPKISEFTIQGPQASEHNYSNNDIYYGLKDYYLVGRAHYKVTRDSNGKVTLDGETQMFVYDYYNFRPVGVEYPLFGSKVPQGNLLQMSITNDPNTRKPMASPFYVYLYEPPQKSYITASR